MGFRGSMKRYLLGEASEKERLDLESRYLSDPTLFEELVEAENDLIDSYVRGELSGRDRTGFEKAYLTSPDRRARVQFAGALAEVSHENLPDARKTSIWDKLTLLFSHPASRLQWGMVLAGVAALLVIGWVSVSHHHSLLAKLPPAPRNRSASPPLSTTPEPKSNVTKSGSKAEPEMAQVDRPELNEFTLQLIPGVSRATDDHEKAFRVPRTPWVRFQLVLDHDDGSTYVAVLETAEGQEIQRVEGLKGRLSNGNKVTDVRVPSKIIKPGDYVIRLSEASAGQSNDEDIAEYSFRAESN
jgi:hypothetical protein